MELVTGFTCVHVHLPICMHLHVSVSSNQGLKASAVVKPFTLLKLLSAETISKSRSSLAAECNTHTVKHPRVTLNFQHSNSPSLLIV